MKYLDLTFPTPEENLACDEVLLDLCEEDNSCGGVLRFWEPHDYFVVMGYSNKAAREIHIEVCQKKGIPVLRRISGGGTVLQGPGCLNFSLILKTASSPHLRSISKSNAFIMERHAVAIQPFLGTPIEIQGSTDLTLAGRKFSGNAQRRRRTFLLFHGTFLLDFNLEMMQEFLPLPSKQPLYRKDRSHQDFLTNLKISGELIKDALRRLWNAKENLAGILSAPIQELVRTRYSDPAWNLKL